MKKLILCLAAASAIAQATPLAQVKLIDSGSPLLSSGGTYVGPYKLKVNDRLLNVLCIDLADESRPGAHWSAYLSSLPGQLDQTYHPDEIIQYKEEAYLYSLIVQPGADRVALQGAAWAILDAAYKPSRAAKVWMALAARNYADIDLNGFTIISDSQRHSEKRNQEFITMLDVPEPGLLSVLVGLMLTTVALVGRRRN